MSAGRAELVLANARVVAGDAVLERGTVVVRGGLVAEVAGGRGAPGPGAVDLGGDWLLPGFVELHTDNLERQFSPRPGVRWPPDAAMLQHDAQVAAAGITTSCDAVCVGFYGTKAERLELLRASLDAVDRARAAGALKAEHLLHLRLETSDPGCVELFEPLMDRPGLALVSFMDHTPGQRQWRDLDRYRAFHTHAQGMDDATLARDVEGRIAEQRAHAARNRVRLLALLEGHPAVRASHDDTTAAHVAEGLAAGVTVSEFPTSLEAARAARTAGMGIVMGAPNLVLGGSHSGNVAAAALAAEGLLDALSSDYVPWSLAQGAFRLAVEGAITVPEAAACLARRPAAMLGLADRGEIAPGLRADLVRVREVTPGVPAIAGVWRLGERVA